MVAWRFGETERDGEVWLAHPSMVQVYVDYEARDKNGVTSWRRILVATKSYLDAHLKHVGFIGERPRWAAVPRILILPDASGEALKRAVDTVIQEGGFDSYSTPLGAENGTEE